jgi:fructose-bisphosphate aldolase class 1
MRELVAYPNDIVVYRVTDEHNEVFGLLHARQIPLTLGATQGSVRNPKAVAQYSRTGLRLQSQTPAMDDFYRPQIGPEARLAYIPASLTLLRKMSMADQSMKAHITEAGGFLAALDQSGGSTPGALRLYGIPESAYSGDAEMFALMHEMRVRVMTAPAFTKQQFEIGAQISRHGLIPILEPEVSIKSPDKPKAEALLRDALARHLDTLADDQQVMLKLTIPDVPDLYKDLIAHDRVVRVVALSGGYSRHDACQRLARNHGMIASFSRALLEELRASMSDQEFDAALAEAIDEIYKASTVKV